MLRAHSVHQQHFDPNAVQRSQLLSYYEALATTRTFADRLETIEHVRESGMKVYCGGIVHTGECPADRVAMLVTLANLPHPPESVPINQLVPVAGTPLAASQTLSAIEFVGTIALAHILMPTSFIRLSAGRVAMSDEPQAWSFFAGGNSIVMGETLFTAGNLTEHAGESLFRRLGLTTLNPSHLA